MPSHSHSAATPSVCECGQLRVTGIYRGGAISCPVCNGTPRQPPPFDVVEREDPESAKRSCLAQLRQMTWEATQWLSRDEVREYVESVLREVESDEP